LNLDGKKKQYTLRDERRGIIEEFNESILCIQKWPDNLANLMIERSAEGE
jgi:hypothetical protein